jgi:membrane protein implicated in regulation of membrane protease activity
MSKKIINIICAVVVWFTLLSFWLGIIISTIGAVLTYYLLQKFNEEENGKMP